MCSVWLVPPILDIDFIEIITEGLPYFHQELGQQTLRSFDIPLVIDLASLWCLPAPTARRRGRCRLCLHHRSMELEGTGRGSCRPGQWSKRCCRSRNTGGLSYSLGQERHWHRQSLQKVSCVRFGHRGEHRFRRPDRSCGFHRRSQSRAGSA